MKLWPALAQKIQGRYISRLLTAHCCGPEFANRLTLYYHNHALEDSLVSGLITIKKKSGALKKAVFTNSASCSPYIEPKQPEFMFRYNKNTEGKFIKDDGFLFPHPKVGRMKREAREEEEKKKAYMEETILLVDYNGPGKNLILFKNNKANH